MDSEALVQLALEALSCNQKDLAIKVGVSPTQISKWKKGEHISFEMERKLRDFSGIGEMAPSFVLLAGSIENAHKWERLIKYLAKSADESSETGYDTPPLYEDVDILCWSTFDTLKNMGVDIPKDFPSALDFDYYSLDLDDDFFEVFEEHPHAALLRDIYRSFTDVYGFFAAYIQDLIFDDDLGLFETPAENIEPCLMDLAACKISDTRGLARDFESFRYKTMKDYEGWINIVKDRAFRGGVPLRAELLGLVHNSNDELGHEAEAESLGFNASRIHPDIYMNELLVGMRMIHKVLPAIMKKLEIHDEFQLDESELRLK